MERAYYLADRLVHLGIPLLMVAVVTHPTLLYFVAIHVDNTGGASWGQYV